MEKLCVLRCDVVKAEGQSIDDEMMTALAQNMVTPDIKGNLFVTMEGKAVDKENGWLKTSFDDYKCWPGAKDARTLLFESKCVDVYIRLGDKPFAVVGLKEGELTNFGRAPCKMSVALDVDRECMSDVEKTMLDQFAKPLRKSSDSMLGCSVVFPCGESAFKAGAVALAVRDELGQDQSADDFVSKHPEAPYIARRKMMELLTSAKTPRECKTLPFKCRHFDKGAWDGKNEFEGGWAKAVMMAVIAGKFDYNPKIMSELYDFSKSIKKKFGVDSSDIYFVEPSEKDNRWGTGRNFADCVSFAFVLFGCFLFLFF
jgi:predicted NAD-dependent protein-ADP-ribosyltransferase YbiA (DUF1768 family)